MAGIAVALLRLQRAALCNVFSFRLLRYSSSYRNQPCGTGIPSRTGINSSCAPASCAPDARLALSHRVGARRRGTALHRGRERQPRRGVRPVRAVATNKTRTSPSPRSRRWRRSINAASRPSVAPYRSRGGATRSRSSRTSCTASAWRRARAPYRSRTRARVLHDGVARDCS